MNQWSFQYRNPLVHSRGLYIPSHITTIRPNSGNFLAHYGVPGQKWGVITKEYQPVAVDHRKTGVGSTNSDTMQIRKDAANSSRKKWQQTESAAYKRQQIVERALVGAGIVAALLATYGAIKYRQIKKAKAYSGLLSRFIQQNPGISIKTESGRQLLRRGSTLAKANSMRYRDAANTVRYFKSKGMNVPRKQALNIYRQRNRIDKISKIENGSNAATRIINEIRRRRLAGKIVSRING